MKKLLSTLLALSMVVAMLTTGVAFAASDAVQADADALTLDDILSVPSWNGNMLIDNLDIDVYTTGEVNASPITWSSNNEAVISASGVVTRGAEDAEVTVTATIGTGDDAATKDFTFVVPAATKSINGMPAVTSLKYEDTFSDGIINESKFATNTPDKGDSAVEANGKFTLTRTGWVGGEPHIEINHEYNGGTSTTLEMTLESSMAYVRLPFIGYNWNGYPLYIHWYPKNNNISIGTSGVQTDSADAGRIPLPESAKGGKAKFTVTVNTSAKTYDVWVNNELVIAGNPYLQSSAQKPYKIRVLTVTGGWMYGIGSTSIDNLKIYESEETDTYASLKTVINAFASNFVYTADDKNYLIGEYVNLGQTEGTNGTTISYDISDTSLVSESGKVTRALTDKPLTITATITDADGGTLSKTYSYIVPGKYNKIGKPDMPLVDTDYSVTGSAEASITDTTIQTAYSDNNGVISFTSAAAWNKEPGFKYNYSDNLKGSFAQDVVFSSTSKALRIRLVDSAWARKLDFFYYGGTLVASANEAQEYSQSLANTVIKLTLCYDMENNCVDIYVNGSLWLNDFALLAGSYKNIQYMQVSHHCATLNGAERWGQGTTTFYSLGAYKLVDEAVLSPVMKGDAAFSNEGTVVAGNNSVTLPVIATDPDGESIGGTIIYAIYGNVNGVYKLAGLDIVPLELDRYAHREYTANVNIDAVPENAVQKVLVWNTTEGITPVDFGAFPQN